MRMGLRGRIRGVVLAVGAATALVGASCSKSGPVKCGDFLMYDDNCSATAVTWQVATGDTSFQPFIQKMVAGGCSTPLQYTPCKDNHCNSGKLAADPQFISTCPAALAQSVAADSNKIFHVIAPGVDGTDRCTGVPPENWAIVMWPPHWMNPLPGKCPTANCGG